MADQRQYATITEFSTWDGATEYTVPSDSGYGVRQGSLMGSPATPSLLRMLMVTRPMLTFRMCSVMPRVRRLRSGMKPKTLPVLKPRAVRSLSVP